jgi:hypothetical protein
MTWQLLLGLVQPIDAKDSTNIKGNFFFVLQQTHLHFLKTKLPSCWVSL